MRQLIKFVRSDAVVTRAIAGETLIIPVRGGVGDLASIYSLNEVGTRIWDLLATPTSVEELVGALEQEYEVSRDRLFNDLTLLLADMQSAGLSALADAEQTHASERLTIMETNLVSG